MCEGSQRSYTIKFTILKIKICVCMGRGGGRFLSKMWKCEDRRREGVFKLAELHL